MTNPKSSDPRNLIQGITPKNLAESTFFENGIVAPNTIKTPMSLSIKKERSITKIDKNVWDNLYGNTGLQNWDGMHWQESCFNNNAQPEHNWKFYYFLVYDENRIPLIATFFTHCIIKDDFVSPKSVSTIIEKERIHIPYYMTTETLLMGTPLTTGTHLYINRKHSQWKQALALLLEEIELVKQKTRLDQIILRDFSVADFEIRHFLTEQGFLKINIPWLSSVNEIKWTNSLEYLRSINARNRIKLTKNALPYIDLFQVDYITQQILNTADKERIYMLYRQYKNENLEINTFDIPKYILDDLLNNRNWEAILLRLKDDNHASGKIVAVALCYKTNSNYIPYWFGIDNNYKHTHFNNVVINYYSVLRAGKLGKKVLQFGYTTSFEYSMFEARAIPHVMYIQANHEFYPSDIETEVNTRFY